MVVAVLCEDMAQGCFRATQFFCRESSEEGSDAPKIVVLMPMYEMDMNNFPELLFFHTLLITKWGLLVLSLPKVDFQMNPFPSKGLLPVPSQHRSLPN